MMQQRFLPLTFDHPLVVLALIALIYLGTGSVAALHAPVHLTTGQVDRRATWLRQADSEAPTTPTDLTVDTITQTTLVLTWTAATDNVGVVGYRLYERMRINPTYWRWLLRVNDIGAPMVTLTNLEPGSLHRYAVTAFDAAGNESPKSALYQLTTLQAPQAYHPVTQGEQIVAIVGEPFHYTVAALGIPSPTFTLAAGPLDMNVDPLTGLVTWTPPAAAVGIVTATVRAVNSQGLDDHTFTIPVQPASVDLQPPGLVMELRASTVTTHGATLHWLAATDNVAVAGYRILAQAADHGQSLFLAGDTGSPVTTFTITTFEPGQNYRIWVAAYDAAGNVASISGVDALLLTTLSASADTPITGLVGQNSSPTTIGVTTLFTATLTDGTNVNYLWRFGDGALATGQWASHVYTNTGIYTATITAANSLGAITDTTIVLITPAPLSNTNQITVTPPTPSANEPISITIAGRYPNNCTPIYGMHQQLAQVITLVSTPSAEPFCLPVETAWGYTVPIGTLPANRYTIIHYVGALMTDMATFTVTAILTPSIQLGLGDERTLAATSGEIFHYQVDATGTPPLHFALTAAPPGMQIDPASGLIEWQPITASSTQVAFTVHVTNAVGRDDYTFQVQVVSPTVKLPAFFLPLMMD